MTRGSTRSGVGYKMSLWERIIIGVSILLLLAVIGTGLYQKFTELPVEIEKEEVNQHQEWLNPELFKIEDQDLTVRDGVLKTELYPNTTTNTIPREGW
jgi:hypothetical protein